MTDVGAELPHVCRVEHIDEWLEVAEPGPTSNSPRGPPLIGLRRAEVNPERTAEFPENNHSTIPSQQSFLS
jgi:hypothetical protein